MTLVGCGWHNELTEACDRSIVSKMRDMTADIWMTSPLIRQSFLLSSNTVFMFSIQTASMGPSNTTHLRSGVSVDANSRNVLAVIPSDHCNLKSRPLLVFFTLLLCNIYYIPYIFYTTYIILHTLYYIPYIFYYKIYTILYIYLHIHDTIYTLYST